MSNTPTLLSLNSPTDITTTCKTYPLTPTELTTLQTRSAAAKLTAYCPYSRFRVGATILAKNGEFVDGANVENAAYPVGTCAERVAFGKAVTGGWREVGFRALGLSTDVRGGVPASPCGMCRQFIREFCDLDMPIFMFDNDGNFVVAKLEELLPMSFGPEALPPRESLG